MTALMARAGIGGLEPVHRSRRRDCGPRFLVLSEGKRLYISEEVMSSRDANMGSVVMGQPEHSSNHLGGDDQSSLALVHEVHQSTHGVDVKIVECHGGSLGTLSCPLELLEQSMVDGRWT